MYNVIYFPLMMVAVFFLTDYVILLKSSVIVITANDKCLEGTMIFSFYN